VESMNKPDPTLETTKVKQPGHSDMAIGCVETSSIARGLETADAMLKAARVELLACNPTCPGKYIIMVGGSTSEVDASVTAGQRVASDTLVETTVIPRVHPQVIQAFTATTMPEEMAAVGMIETFSIVASVRAGDQAVKAAQVDLLEIRLARALGGKAYVLFTGEVSAVRAALDAGSLAARKNGLILGQTLIPAPHPDLLTKLL